MNECMKTVSVTIFLVWALNAAIYPITLAEEHEDWKDDFSSDFQHEFSGKLCDDPPPPMFSELQCGTHRKKKDKYVCRAECDFGFQFPDGKVKRRHICDLKTGKWTPKYEFLDCEPICNPPCQNRGECTENNHCVCSPGYRGDRCQFATNVCDPSKSLHVTADWKCNHTSFDTLCVLNCPQGTQYESPPAEIYRCSLDGSWTPNVAPRCLPINIIEPPSSHGMFSIEAGRMDTSRDTKIVSSGVCAAWRQQHYRTFDGGMYSFQGSCTYLLAKDCTEDTFAIHIDNVESCDSVASCPLTVIIYLGKEEHQLLRTPDGPAVTLQGKTFTVPASLNGLLFEMVSNYLTVTSISLGFRLKWNGKSTVLLKVNDQLKNKTCGLCGRFDGTALNDFEMVDGKITDNVEAFVNSWTMETLTGSCSKGALVQHPCSAAEKDVIVASNKICEAIFDEKYSVCHHLVDPRVYFEACKMDFCGCSEPNPFCICNSLAEYFRECIRFGGKIEGGWRSETLCPLRCPDGMVYDDCGTSCPRTCKNTVYDCEDSHCVDGCHCPAGTVMNNGQCIKKEHCPCQHKGKEFGNGERITQECNACECLGGQWECTKEKCEARCSSVGDGHYTTFDGSKYEFLGSCPHYLVYHENFTVIQESGPCTGESNGVEREITPEAFCTQSIVLEFETSSVVFKPNTEVVFNGNEIHNYPFSENGFTVSLASSIFYKVELPNGLSLMWDGKNRIYVDAPPSLIGQTKGLCGTFNNNQKDDFLTPDNDMEADVNVFASRWEASDSCHKRSRKATRPCDRQPQKAEDAARLCSLMKSAIFEECHDDVDPEIFYSWCTYDLCACNQDLEACLCPALSNYGAACARKGAIVHWAEQVTPCRPHCENGQIYQECGNPCKSTCLSISSLANCREKCVQGCSCPDGMTLNGDGFCVPIDQCPCVYEGKEYTSASVKLQGSNICQCESALWKCKPATLDELVRLNPDLMIEDRPRTCSGQNQEFVSCVENCPSTCQNMHLFHKCKTKDCKPGCRCKRGYILDADLDRCVLPSECGCRHGGRKYVEADSLMKECNLCTCEKGSWRCTEKVCPGVCTVWGESHYKTFDDRIYDFHGDCEYILSKGSLDLVAFTLSIQNVPCGTSGITCSKSFTLDLGGDLKLTLTRGEPIPRNKIGSRFSILEVGFFVSIHTDIGLSLQWDKGTRIYLTLDPRWRDRVVGLCGNFNDDQSDDFQTPSGGLPEARPPIFADSWKVQESCPYPQIIEDACSIHPDRQNWAHKKCAILKSDVFAPCHSEVALSPYHERCVFDACACDMGGDCECLCTAIAAYAQECNVHGVPIKWRSQELCPIQCEECSSYESCMLACPTKTCENKPLFDEEVCAQENCVEGCKPKPCPPGQIYDNDINLKCIPEAECVTPCMEFNGKMYYEGERITDLELVDVCQSCHCLKGEVVCTGQPCQTTTERPISLIRVPCEQTGWTPWMNTPRVIGGDFELLQNFELESVYLKYCGLSNATSIECRDSQTKMSHKEAGQNVICELPKGLSCKDSEQISSICQDYEIRIFCDCGPIPITTTFIMKPTPRFKLLPLPPKCLAPGWTFWMNSNSPNQFGDLETIDNLRLSYLFCGDDEIEKVECRSATSGKSYEFGGDDVQCTANRGLICKNSDNKICDDYEIRFYCKCEHTDCDYPRGMENRAIKPKQIVISSFWMEDTDGDKARLNGYSAWRTGNVELQQWIQIDLEEKQEITGIITQGSPKNEEWVTVYKIDYSDDNVEFKFVKDAMGNDMVFRGNFDGFSEVKNMFSEPIFARYIKLVPLKWHQWISLRLEILGCNREVLLTSAPYSPETTTVAITTPGCVHGWTQFFNVDDPQRTQDANDLGDEETIARIRRRFSLCPGGVIEDVECKGFHDGGIVDYRQTGQFGLKCSKRIGFICNNYLQSRGQQCYDYMVRFYCACEFQKSVKPPRPKSTTPVFRTCGWTPWLNIDLPKDGPVDGGDFETIELLQERYQICRKPELKNIECRMSLTLHPFNESQQNDLICDIENGFRCYNKLQIGDCYDYEVRLYCLYDWCPSRVTEALITETTTAIEVTTTAKVTTENPCPNGQVYEKCAYNCSQTCFSFLSFLHSRNECLSLGNSHECIEGCRPIIGCNPPKFWRDYALCVPRDECTCVTEEGRIVSPHGVVEKDCEKCQCLDNNLTCFQMPGCGKTTPTIPSQIKTTTLAPPMNIEKEDCWTEWVNIDSPESGGGDFENVGKIRQRYEFCVDPVAIECRTVIGKQKATDTGQKVTCDLSGGLICWNSANAGSDCSDYEVRFFCPCPGMTVTSTVSLSTMPPAPCQNGWTKWFNSHKPDAKGDYETVQSIRTVGGYFCSNDMITAIECEQAGNPELQIRQHGVVCELSTGLICLNSDLGGTETCNDYKVRFYCDCPLPSTAKLTTEEITVTETTISETTVPKLVTCDYWSDWINEHHPDSSQKGKEKGKKGTKKGVVTGDVEKRMLFKFQTENGFCKEGKLTIIECRDAETGLDYTETGDSKLVCSLNGGFRCRGKEQTSRFCRDYKIRYYCECSITQTTTSMVLPTTLPVTITTVSACSSFYYIIDGPHPLSDSSLKASTSKDAFSGAQNARLHSIQSSKSAGAWIAGTLNSNQYLEIDLGSIQPVYGVVTKGRNNAQEWVKSYYVLYSRDGITFDYVYKISNLDRREVFTGNFDSESEVKHMFAKPFEARYVRIQPITYMKEIALRVELLGCGEGKTTTFPTTTFPTTTEMSAICKDEMGMENGQLSDNQIYVSSSHEASSGSSSVRLRLNTTQNRENSGGWVAGVLDDEQYVQIDFLEPRTITGIITKGRDNVPEWVTAFTVSYSDDNIIWNPVLNADGKIKVFPGNHDNLTPVLRFFPRAIRSRFVRIHPLKWNNWISMRLEILGCFEPYPTTVHVTEVSTTTVWTERVCSVGVSSQKVTCDVTGSFFNTFDGLGYEYEICDHVLMKDQRGDLFTVSIHKDCPQQYRKCQKYLKVNVDNDTIILGPGLDDLQLNGYEVPILNLWLLEKKYPDFKFVRQENLLSFDSLKYHFEVSLDSKQNTVIMISKCPNQDVLGMCGFYNGHIDDDPKKPDGSLALSDVEFGNSWSIGDIERCLPSKCPTDISIEAIEVCNKMKEIPLSKCESYVNTADLIDECVHFVCECLQQSSNLQPEEGCRCKAYESFAAECEKSSGIIIIDNWQFLLNCGGTKLTPTMSEAPITTTTTEIISTQLIPTEILCTEKAKLEKVSCEVAGSLFSTFDGLNYEYEICNHILMKDQMDDHFTITIHKDCTWQYDKCSKYLNIKVNEDIITLGPDLDDLMLNDHEVPIQNLWLLANKYPEFIFDRKENQFSFRSMQYNFEVTLDSQQNVLIMMPKCPSNKVVGLCGFYNGYTIDDRKSPEGFVVANNEEFGSSWSIGNDERCIPHKCPEEAMVKATILCHKLKEPPLNMCQQYLNTSRYIEECNNFMCECLEQPLSLQDSCKCQEYEKFIAECEKQGMQTIQDWKFDLNCEEIVSTEAVTTVSEIVKGITSFPTTPFIFEECRYPMGIENGEVADITVSSSLMPWSGATRIHLNTKKDENGTGGWVASPSDYNPSVVIDFYDIRNISGIITQGREDADMWVISYTIQYSLDKVNWSYVVESSSKSEFSGNENRNSMVFHLFHTMVEARAIKINIQDYHEAPAMRLELLGCLKPYLEVTPPPPPVVTSTELCIEYGAWVSIADPSASFGDEEPIDKVIEVTGSCTNPLYIQCRSMVTKIDYRKTGDRVTCDLTHGLLCKNIDQPSGYCNNYEVRIGCWSCGITTMTTAPLPVMLCPEFPPDLETNCPISCPVNHSCDGSSCVSIVDCPCFKENKRFSPGDIMVSSDCQICSCALEGNSLCKPKICPSCGEDQKPELSKDCQCSCKECSSGTVLCPTSGQCINSELWCDGIVNCPDDETNCPTTAPTTTIPTTTTGIPSSTELLCTREMKEDRVTCEMAINLFHTFDGLEYQYEICDHILMREKSYDLYSVSVHKSCSKEVSTCRRYVVIQIDDESITLGPGSEDLVLNGQEISISNLWLLRKRYPDLILRKEGNQLVAGSLKYDFEVTWDSRQDVRITMSRCPFHQVVGLCGFYTGYVDDDRLKPDGFLASKDEEFGDSWGIDDKERCAVPVCPVDTMTTAFEVCQQLNELPFSNCSDILNIAVRMETCVAFMCECLQESGSSTSSDLCKCKAYSSFVEACERINNGPLFEWRLQYDCAPTCPPGLEWQDCGPGCELTCDNFRNNKEICTDSCIPGCYCPSGLVRHNNKCIKPKMCQDCVCRGHGDPNYITFDGHYYAFQGICSYVLAQHQASDETFNFQVLVTNVECPDEPHTSCADGITIIWNGHKIQKFKDKPVQFDERELSDNDLPLELKDISITSVARKSFVAHIKQINLVVRYFDDVYGFNVELPSYLYFNETEGLCGICNFEESDDLYHKEGFVTDNVEDFAFSWLSSDTRNQCTLPRVPVPTVQPEICNFTSNPCDIFINPMLYSKSCQNDIKYSVKPLASVCRSKLQYAQQCCERGISLHEWLFESECLLSCSKGMILSCTSPCQKTCENYKSYNADDCNLKTVLTCTCPDGKVLKDNQCVDHSLCETCDSEGHMVGDMWDKGPCERCSCLENGILHCTEISCPQAPVCNEGQFVDTLPQHPHACCPIYKCKAASRIGCPPSTVPDCEPGETAIIYRVEDCPVYKCECQKNLCPLLVKPTMLEEEGEQYFIETIGCCQQYVSKCIPENCQAPSKCAPGFKITTYEGKCCTKYSCVPKKNVCVYQHKFEVINGTELPLPLEQYYDMEYEADSSWHDGLCRKCSCTELNGQFASSCVIQICLKTSELLDVDLYIYEAEHIPGACCPKYHRVRCMSNGIEYSVGDEWASPDGNACKRFRCVLTPHGEVARMERTTTCDKICPPQAVYIEPETGSQDCCGYCKPVACEEGGTIYEDGATWNSVTKPCFTGECSISGNRTQIMYRGRSCPALPRNCPEEHIATDSAGCCKYCEVPPELCSPVQIPLQETVHFFNFVDEIHGVCSNKQIIKNLTKCTGQCESTSFYSAQLDDFESTCKCCTLNAAEKRQIRLNCKDGFEIKKIYHQPISCSCSSCSERDYAGTVRLPTPY